MPTDLMPALAVTVVPVLLILAVAYPLRPQYGRRTAGLIVRVAAGWTPYDLRVRRAVGYFADKEREAGLGDVPARAELELAR